MISSGSTRDTQVVAERVSLDKEAAPDYNPRWAMVSWLPSLERQVSQLTTALAQVNRQLAMTQRVV
uniref:Uncharacterized protein n=1 Tax=Acetithermum autotrophicum TaxID=1446466 RepID=H5SRL7_ACEAU|nr:hypothetical protein HGMM_OP2C282 [Candidatus Acetothermum autotrophicum]